MATQIVRAIPRCTSKQELFQRTIMACRLSYLWNILPIHFPCTSHGIVAGGSAVLLCTLKHNFNTKLLICWACIIV